MMRVIVALAKLFSRWVEKIVCAVHDHGSCKAPRRSNAPIYLALLAS